MYINASECEKRASESWMKIARDYQKYPISSYPNNMLHIMNSTFTNPPDVSDFSTFEAYSMENYVNKAYQMI